MQERLRYVKDPDGIVAHARVCVCACVYGCDSKCVFCSGARRTLLSSCFPSFLSFSLKSISSNRGGGIPSSSILVKESVLWIMVQRVRFWCS